MKSMPELAYHYALPTETATADVLAFPVEGTVAVNLVVNFKILALELDWRAAKLLAYKLLRAAEEGEAAETAAVRLQEASVGQNFVPAPNCPTESISDMLSGNAAIHPAFASAFRKS